MSAIACSKQSSSNGIFLPLWKARAIGIRGKAAAAQL